MLLSPLPPRTITPSRSLCCDVIPSRFRRGWKALRHVFSGEMFGRRGHGRSRRFVWKKKHARENEKEVGARDPTVGSSNAVRFLLFFLNSYENSRVIFVRLVHINHTNIPMPRYKITHAFSAFPPPELMNCSEERCHYPEKLTPPSVIIVQQQQIDDLELYGLHLTIGPDHPDPPWI